MDNIKEDKYRIVQITRVNPNGQYGTYTYTKGLTKEQLQEIERILQIKLEDYKFC